MTVPRAVLIRISRRSHDDMLPRAGFPPRLFSGETSVQTFHRLVSWVFCFLISDLQGFFLCSSFRFSTDTGYRNVFTPPVACLISLAGCFKQQMFSPFDEAQCSTSPWVSCSLCSTRNTPAQRKATDAFSRLPSTTGHLDVYDPS